MSKIAYYLQEHLLGEVTTGHDARIHFATDASIFTVRPSIIVYPQDENDVRKTARFTWQLAERGRIVPITARGAGTDQAGAAIGEGIILAFPAHMNRIIELDPKNGAVIVEPGLNYGRLQQTLHTHERFMPPYPASVEYSTIGGAVANNAAGEKSVKYGSTSEYVRSLRVVLANGEVIETGRLTKRELSKKLGLSTFEGEVYRAIDSLIEENRDTLQSSALETTKNTAGYALAQVKRKDGSFDLTPLFVGSQGTLGIITEIRLASELYNPESTVILAEFESMEQVEAAVVALKKLDSIPSALELIDDQLLEMVERINPNQLKGIAHKPYARATMLIEFDDHSDRSRKKALKQAEKILSQYTLRYSIETEQAAKDKLWKLRRASSTVIGHAQDRQRAVPIIDDGIVPLEKLSEYISGVYRLFAEAKLPVAVWGHIGDGNLHVQPFLDLSQLGDRQKAFKLIDAYYRLVIGLGGSTSGQHNDGRLRAPYLSKLYGEDLYKLFVKVKAICDPYGTLNPGVKVGVKLDDIKPLVRNEYTLGHLHDHMPHS